MEKCFKHKTYLLVLSSKLKEPNVNLLEYTDNFKKQVELYGNASQKKIIQVC